MSKNAVKSEIEFVREPLLAKTSASTGTVTIENRDSDIDEPLV